MKKLLCLLFILSLTSCFEIDVDKEESSDKDFDNIFIPLDEISYERIFIQILPHFTCFF